MKKIKKIFLNLKEAIERHRQLSIDRENAHNIIHKNKVIIFERKDSVGYIVYLENAKEISKKRNNTSVCSWYEAMMVVNHLRKQNFIVEIKDNIEKVLEITKEILIYGNYPPVIIELKPEDIK
jgi:hypothetical protein